MAVERTGTAVNINTSSDSGSQSITVPSDATLAVVFFGGYIAAGTHLASDVTLTLGGTTMTNVGHNPGTTSGVDGIWIRHLVNPATGSQTFGWSTGRTFQYGILITIVFYRGVDTATPIKSSSLIDTINTPTASITGLTYATGDMMVGGVQSDTVPTVTGDGQTSINVSSQGAKGGGYLGVAEEASTGAFYCSGLEYSGLGAVVIAAGGAVTLSPPVIASTSSLYNPQLSLNISGAFIASTSNLYGFALSLFIEPPLIISGSSLYNPTIGRGAVTLAPPVIVSTSSLYVPTIAFAGAGNPALQPPFITSTSTLYEPVVGRGAVTLATPFIGSTSVSHNPTLAPGAVSIAPPLVASTGQMFEPKVTRAVSPPLFTNSSTVHTPTVGRGAVALGPPVLASSSTVFSPTVTPGARTLAPPVIASTSALYTPRLSRYISPPLLTNSSMVFSPTVAPGASVLAPQKLTNESTLFTPGVTPGVTQGAAFLAPPFVANTNLLFAPVAKLGIPIGSRFIGSIDGTVFVGNCTSVQDLGTVNIELTTFSG